MNNRKTPIIRFKGFTDDWEQRKLGEISPLRGGFAFKSEEYADEGIPIIRISNILSDGTVGAEFAYCKEQTDDAAFTLKNGAALLAMSGATTGKVSVLHARNTDKYYQNQRVGYFTQTRDYDYGFVSMMVRSQMFLDQLSAVLVAGAQSNVSSKDIDGFEFMIPMSKVEQEKLGELFFSLDNLITLHQRKLEKLKIVKKAMLENCFPKNGEKVPRFRFSGFTGDWEQRKLGDIYARSGEKNDGSVGIDRNITVATMQFKDDVKVSTTEYLKTYYTFNVGDIAFEGHQSKEFRFGRFVENDIGNGIVSHIFAVFRPIVEYDLKFWKYAINNERLMQRVLSRSTKASTMMHDLVTDDFLNESFLVPTIEEQRKIGDYFSHLDHLITLHQRKLEKLKIIKKSFLEKMFV